MSEIRLNPIANEWVVLLTERTKKPEEFRRRDNHKRRLPELDPNCPFCPGSEEKTPGELLRIPSEGPWRIRVIPNKFSTLLQEGESTRHTSGVKRSVLGVGRHEIIVESPLHNSSIALQSTSEVIEVIETYKARFIDAFTDSRVRHVILFKNHGTRSGTTLLHSHAQLIGTPIVPMQTRNRVDEGMRFFDHTGECLICAIIKDELQEGHRVIVETDNFISVIPYAALSPFHTWILPKRHAQTFAAITEPEISDLAHILKTTLQKLHEGLDDPDYNLVFRSLSPFRGRSEYIHWYLSIVPQVISASGFELGSGMHVNPAIPEEVAAYLRDIKVS